MARRFQSDGAGARSIRYWPLHSESALLYLAWITQNRARVDASSHVDWRTFICPTWGKPGFREFIKWWYPQIRKEGLVVDVRDNGGGNISQMLLEKIGAVLRGTRYSRNQTSTGTYPGAVQPGPKAALINEGMDRTAIYSPTNSGSGK